MKNNYYLKREEKEMKKEQIIVEKLPAFREEIDNYEITEDDVFICPQCGELELKDEEVYIKGVSLCRGCAIDV